ncbi:MAG: biotin synthase BioB [Maricaulaceae bacterium]|jgi:biotin synthase
MKDADIPLAEAWSKEDIAALFERPFADLILEAQTVLRENWAANAVQTCQLLSIKTGGCPEDCGYCSQSAHFDTGVPASKLLDRDVVLAEAKAAKDGGATRFCMGAAWRGLKDRDMDKVCDLISEVKAIGLETCVTLGMLEDGQAEKLKTAGLDYYNHNLDTSPEHYAKVVTTRTYEDRLDTLEKVREAGLKTCCGGILGLGESREDRVSFIHAMASLPAPPESVPINGLMRVPGTPLAGSDPVDPLEFVRTIAVARIVFPTSMVRLSAGRESMSRELQALCFLAGANSIFVGSKLLTTPNPEKDDDAALFAALGLKAMTEDEARR